MLQGLSNGRPACACCPERRLWALTVDHIHGGGNAHRRTVAQTSSWRLVWKELKAGDSWEELRDRYQVLCATCNQGRRVNGGVCPHVAEHGSSMTTSTRNALKSYAKVFLATVLALFLSDGADVLGVSWSDLRTWIAAGMASVLPLVITWLDPSDPRFGRGA